MSDAPPRLFFALVPHEPAVRFLVSQQDQLRRCGWERYVRFSAPESLHLTLRFLGPVGETALPDLINLVREATSSALSFEFELGKATLFPRVSRAKTVATQISPNFRLKTLARAIDKAATAVGIPEDGFPFRPHITLARLKTSASRPGLPKLGGRMIVPAAKVVLYASDLNQEGSTYRELASFALGT